MLKFWNNYYIHSIQVHVIEKSYKNLRDPDINYCKFSKCWKIFKKDEVFSWNLSIIFTCWMYYRRKLTNQYLLKEVFVLTLFYTLKKKKHKIIVSS
jgi:hypothetical protein